MTDEPRIERIQVVEVRPTDVVVLTVPGNSTQDEVDRLAALMKERWPDNRIAVLSEGAKLSIHRPTEAAP